MNVRCYRLDAAPQQQTPFLLSTLPQTLHTLTDQLQASTWHGHFGLYSPPLRAGLVITRRFSGVYEGRTSSGHKPGQIIIIFFTLARNAHEDRALGTSSYFSNVRYSVTRSEPKRNLRFQKGIFLWWWRQTS